MKKLIIINGTMGVGKSAVSRIVADRLAPSVVLDGDWCWKMNPWVFTEENEKMVIDNITHLLNSFLANSSFHYIVFCWVLHRESIFEQILSRLNGDYALHKFSLVCSEEALRTHFIKDVRKGSRNMDDLAASFSRMKLYEKLDTQKIDISHLSAEHAADRIVCQIKK